MLSRSTQSTETPGVRSLSRRAAFATRSSRYMTGAIRPTAAPTLVDWRSRPRASAQLPLLPPLPTRNGRQVDACLVGGLDRAVTDRKWAGSERIVAPGAGQRNGIPAAGSRLSQWPGVRALQCLRHLEIRAGRASR